MWLSGLLDTMRATVRAEMSTAVAAYEDKPRDQWLFDHPAQVLPLLLPCSQWGLCMAMSLALLSRGEEG